MRLLIPLLLLACHFPAMAVYKCETQGKSGRTVSYSDLPCQAGKSSTIAIERTTGGPAPEDAETRLERQKEQLQRLERARHRREAQEQKTAQKLAKARAARQKKCAALALRQKWREEDAAMAHGKAADKARLKARRTAEAYQLECAQA